MKQVAIDIYLFIIRVYSYLFGKFGMIVPFPKVTIIKGDSAALDLVKAFKNIGVQKVFLITDEMIFKLGLHKDIVRHLDDEKIEYHIFSEVKPDPDFALVEKGVREARSQNIDAIIAVGGGSVMDAAKIINPCAKYNKNPRKYVGLFKLLKKAYPFACIPTTAGTGSEVTVAAVISDEKTSTKKFCLSPFILPDFVVLEKKLLRSLPPSMVSASGIDALTHAFESYMGRASTKKTSAQSLQSIALIYENLVEAYKNPENLEAKENMLLASHLAGLAFTRTNVGWVHAIAHQIGGLYHVNHGLANAIILPHVAAFYADTSAKKYKEICLYLGLCKESTSEKEATKIFLDSLWKLNSQLAIPQKVKELRSEDCSMIAERAFSEVCAMPYPVPKYFSNLSDLECFIRDSLTL